MEGEEGSEAEVVAGDFLEAHPVGDAVVVVIDLIGETNLLFDDILCFQSNLNLLSLSNVRFLQP